MADRTWTEPFFTDTYAPADGAPRSDVGEVLDDVWTERAAAYELTKPSR